MPTLHAYPCHRPLPPTLHTPTLHTDPSHRPFTHRPFTPTLHTDLLARQVPLKVTLRDVLAWEQRKLAQDIEAMRESASRDDDELRALEDKLRALSGSVGAWVLHTPHPLSTTLGTLTDGGLVASTEGGPWALTVAPIPVASPWGLEVSRRTLLMVVAMAAARLAHAGGPGGSPTTSLALTLRAVTAHGFYCALPASVKEAALTRWAKALREGIDLLIRQDVPIEQRTMLAPELAMAFSQRGGEISAGAARSARCMRLACQMASDGADRALLLTHGHYTATTMGNFHDLRLSRVSVTPIVSTSGVFIHFAPPGLPMMSYSETEQQALTVAIAELDDNARLLQADTATKMNAIVSVGGETACRRHVELAEGRLTRRISSLADKVVANRPRLLLVTSPVDGGVECLAHALELQLRVRELRGICVDVNLWRASPSEPVRLADLRNDLATLYAAGSVTISGGATGEAAEPATRLELPQGGYVIVFGEDLQKTLGGDGAAPPLADLPTPHFRIQALPLVCVNIDDYTCVGGGALLLLRALAKSLAPGGVGVLSQLSAWKRKRPVDCERAFEHIDLTSVGGAISEWKPLNFSFAYELPVYASLLSRHLGAVPISDDVRPRPPRRIAPPPCRHLRSPPRASPRLRSCTPATRAHARPIMICPCDLPPEPTLGPSRPRRPLPLAHAPSPRPPVRQIYPEARRLYDLLSTFDPMPLSYLPSQSPVRAFCGGGGLPSCA